MGQNPTARRFIRLPEVISRVGLKRSRIYDLMKAGTFPQKVKLGEKASAWIESEIDSWMQSRIDMREQNV